MMANATVQAPTGLPREDWLHFVVVPGGLPVLRDQLTRALGTKGGGRDRLVRRVVAQSIGAFIDQHGDSDCAARQVAPLLWEVGDRHARRGLDQVELDGSFKKAEQSVQRGLQFVMSRGASVEQSRHIRTALTVYIRCLHRQALVGWERGRVLHSMQAIPRLVEVPARRERPSDRARLANLVELYDVGPEDQYFVVVTTGPTLGKRLLAHPAALTADDFSEVLLPAAVTVDQVDDLLDHQAAVGPVVPLSDIGESAHLALRMAELLRDGVATHPAMAVPCTDMVGALMVDGNPLLTDLVIVKHLAPLKEMGPRRRVKAAELLLELLELGGPLTKVAHNLGIPVQTAHSRMKVIRQLLGDSIDDPRQRVELIVALQAVLPRWRAAA